MLMANIYLNVFMLIRAQTNHRTLCFVKSFNSTLKVQAIEFTKE